MTPTHSLKWEANPSLVPYGIILWIVCERWSVSIQSISDMKNKSSKSGLLMIPRSPESVLMATGIVMKVKYFEMNEVVNPKVGCNSAPSLVKPPPGSLTLTFIIISVHQCFNFVMLTESIYHLLDCLKSATLKNGTTSEISITPQARWRAVVSSFNALMIGTVMCVLSTFNTALKRNHVFKSSFTRRNQINSTNECSSSLKLRGAVVQRRRRLDLAINCWQSTQNLMP